MEELDLRTLAEKVSELEAKTREQDEEIRGLKEQIAMLRGEDKDR